MKNNRTALVRGGVSLAMGHILVQAFGFAKTIIIARMISPADFGVASAVAACVSIVELISDLGPARFLVQAHDGDKPELLAASHLLQIIRGITNSLVLLCLSTPLAKLFGMPDAATAFRLVAIIPAIRSLTHNDISVMQRSFQYRGTIAWDLAPQAITCLAAPAFAYLFPNYYALVFLLIATSAIAMVTSHIVAKRHYEVRYNKEIFRRFLRFGWPLLLDGGLMMALFHGERIIIGHHFPRAILGAYSAAYVITAAPGFFFAKVIALVGTPYMAGTREVKEKAHRSYSATCDLCGAGAVAIIAPFVLAGKAIIITAYGTRYMVSPVLIGSLACTQAFRIIRVAPAIASISRGDTVVPMLANVARAASLFPAYLCALFGGNATTVVMIGAAGEAASAVASFSLARGRHGLALAPGMKALLTCTIVITLTTTLAGSLGAVPTTLNGRIISLALATVLTAIAPFLVSRRARSLAREAIIQGASHLLRKNSQAS